ncbi:MAG TPA: copper resistance system multicopper oxidase [Acetobacteraceae bacterium]|nr:copper resistance system multicopper oxidase [Acetobacteraceae bacterium]
MVERSLVLRSAAATSRRRFVQGLATAGAVAAVPLSVRQSLAAPVYATPLLSGQDFALEIGPVPMNVTGHARTAIGINGQVPAPILKWREGDTVTLAVTNRLAEPTSIHWHGIRTPAAMDGVPGFSFPGIPPGQTFTYRFPVHQSGTYWYHSHSGYQEQSGLYGAIVVEPCDGYAQAFDRDYIVLLSDWSDEAPETIVSNLKFQSDYYNYGQRTVGTFLTDARENGLRAAVADRLEWGKMRMSPTDILDVTGATYSFLVNGLGPAANWTALFRPGERVRLRFINGSSMSIFDVRIPGLKLAIVQTDGNDVEPVTVDEFRFGPGETYDAIVQPAADQAFTILAQAMDRSGFARGTLAPRAGMQGNVPPLDPRPIRGMADMGMSDMSGMSMDHGSMPGMPPMPGMDHSMMPGMNHGGMSGAGSTPKEGVEVDNVAMMPMDRLGEPGTGLDGNGRQVLRYNDLRALKPGSDPRPPSREIVLHLTGNMQRFMWGFDGRKYSESEPIRLARGERVRFVLINDSMMEHPIHLHGLWSELDNGQGDYRPYKHTILVKPGERLSYLVTADAPGRWAYHCHLLYHMLMGMFREVHVP